MPDSTAVEPTCEIVGLFPIPFMRLGHAIEPELVAACLDWVDGNVNQANSQSEQLAHATVVRPDEHPPFDRLAAGIVPALEEFGVLLFSERLQWSVREMWANALEPGGYQPIHSHANSFIYGIVYLTESHPSASTVDHKALGGNEFAFTNKHADAVTTQFNGDRWVCPPVEPGDIVMYPSYLLHEVPVNESARRVTVAFNAVPHRLKSWGYEIHFSER